MAGNKHNDPLEQLFREKTTEFNIEFNEADWKDIEQRLDQADQAALLNHQNRSMWPRFAAAAILLIILSGLGFIIYQNYNRINELESQLSRQQTEQNSGKVLTDKKAETDENQSDGRINRNQIKNQENKFLTAQKNQFETKQNNPSASTPPNDKTQSQTFKTNQLWATGIEMVNRYEIESAKNAVLPSYPSGLEINSTIDRRSVIAAALGENYTILTSPNISEAYNSFSGFALGLIVGPDLSTVGSFSNFYTPGFKIGATVAYTWNKNIGISTGVIYSKVNYTAEGSEYNPPYGFWSYGTVPLKTEAVCAILSIPLRFKYNFAHLNSSRFYMTAGITSYIMLNETYQFTYAPKKDESHLIQSWSGHTGSRHWLSNATLSIGYAFDISQTISLGIEPYLNIPIRGVGWGNVDLYSTGTLISINYRFQ